MVFHHMVIQIHIHDIIPFRDIIDTLAMKSIGVFVWGGKRLKDFFFFIEFHFDSWASTKVSI